jgi:uroporphyrinogen decarboxylase
MNVRAQRPHAKIIGFPRGASIDNLVRFAAETGVDGLSLDTVANLSDAAKRDGLPVLQGNLDPLVLVAGGNALDRAIDHILEFASERPYIFNLGHGILPETPIAHVERMIQRIRK